MVESKNETFNPQDTQGNTPFPQDTTEPSSITPYPDLPDPENIPEIKYEEATEE